MKKEKMLRAMSLVEEQFVAEADPARRKKKKRNWVAIGAVAACICIAVTAMNLWLFLPYTAMAPDVSRFADSEYYPIIRKLNPVTFYTDGYENNFDRYFANLFRRKVYDSVPNAEEPGYSSVKGETYTEVTDNQVEGVTEADRIKRSDQYIYYLYDDILRVYSIEGKESQEVGSYTIADDTYMRYAATSGWEFYLSADCKMVTVIAYYSDYDIEDHVAVISLDVSDPANITEKNKVTVTGCKLSSRMVDGKLLLLTRFHVGFNPDFSKEEEFLPQITTASGTESIPVEKIFCPEELNSSGYTVVYKFDESTLALEDSAAFLSSSYEEVYVSADTVYVPRRIYENGNERKTEICGLSYTGDTLEYLNNVTVEGYLKDQYSMDEYEGVLRVVTTTYRSQGTSANLYCIDLADWQVAAKVEQFAPFGETVRSVRFDKDAAYVCTAVQQTDPVFFFDLSDLNNITYKDTGTIPGFSTSLIQLGNGYLLGIGDDGSGMNVKVEMYVADEDSVTSVCQYVTEYATYSTEYKSYYINRQEALIGLPLEIYPYGDYRSENRVESYLLLHFDGDSLNHVLHAQIKGKNDYKRAVYIDGYFYMFGDGMFLAQKVG